MRSAKAVFWGSLGALAWTHVGYPLAVAALARVRGRPVRRGNSTPRVSLVVAAHNEQDVIERRLENLLDLDYPPERVEIVVASDGSTDATDELVEQVATRDERVRLLRCPREGKVAAQHRAVRETDSEVIAFTDANARWERDALRALVADLDDPDVGYVCGRLALESDNGASREGLYWRYELWLRAQESRLGSITGGNGSIYAVRRSDYVEDDPRFGHDLGFPYLMAQRGRRAVYEPAAVAWEKPAATTEDEYGRKVRMFAQSWNHVLTGRMLKHAGLLYDVQLLSHRLLRYGSGALHVALLGASVGLARDGRVYRAALAGQLAFFALAAAGRARMRIPGAALAYYYVTVTAATLDGLVRYVRDGVPVVWDKAEGTR